MKTLYKLNRKEKKYKQRSVLTVDLGKMLDGKLILYLG